MKKLLLMLVFSGLLFVSCDEHDHDDDHDHEEHFEAHTWQILDAAGNIYLEITNPQINEDFNLFIALNEGESTTFSVVFLDEEGDVSEPEDEHTLVLVSDDNSIADLVEVNDFSFVLLGNSVGSTVVELQVLHDGHVDARTSKIPVIVE